MKNKHSHQEEKETGEEKLKKETQNSVQEEAKLEQKSSKKMKEELDALEKKYNDLNDSHLRLVAEFDNYRKRTIREKGDLLKTAGESILVNILPLIDDFERGIKAMENTEDVKPVKEGIDLIYNKFLAFLNQNGVKTIETENQTFDMDLHEAITTIPAPSEDLKGKIVDCVSKGYTLNEKVIRFPKVVVGE